MLAVCVHKSLKIRMTSHPCNKYEQITLCYLLSVNYSCFRHNRESGSQTHPEKCVFSTLGGYHEYIGGCLVHRCDTMMHVGGYHEHIGGYHEHIGGYHEHIGGKS